MKFQGYRNEKYYFIKPLASICQKEREMASLVKKARGLRERCEERMPRMAGVGRGGFEATNELDL